MIRLLIADDHAVVRTGLRSWWRRSTTSSWSGRLPTARRRSTLCADHDPDVVLMDLEMPVLDGIEATRRIVEAQPGVAVVVLTSFSDREQILRALDAGAVGYLLKDAEPAELGAPCAPPREVRRRSIHAPAAALLQDRASGSPLDGLSEREREVLGMVARGLPNKLIARELQISEKTVKAHLTSVYRTIGVTDRTQAALWAERNGLGGRRTEVRLRAPASRGTIEA